MGLELCDPFYPHSSKHRFFVRSVFLFDVICTQNDYLTQKFSCCCVHLSSPKNWHKTDGNISDGNISHKLRRIPEMLADTTRKKTQPKRTEKQGGEGVQWFSQYLAYCPCPIFCAPAWLLILSFVRLLTYYNYIFFFSFLWGQGV